MKALILALVLAATTFCQSPLLAQTPPEKTTAKAAGVEKKPRAIPFYGNLAAVNPAAKTLTVGKRVFTTNTETKMYKGNKTVPGSFSDAVVGGKVTGSYLKTSEGKLLAVSVYFK